MRQMIEYIAAAQLIVDDIKYSSGRFYKGRLGGVAYALAGMKYWSNSIGVCSGVGDDFNDNYGAWLLRNGIDTLGISTMAGTTPHTICFYDDSEERVEKAVPGCLEIGKTMLHPSAFPESYKTCKGIYVYLGCEPDYWDELNRWNSGGAVVLWELRGADAIPENRDKLASGLKTADILSINYVEAVALTGEREPETIVRKLHDLGAPVLFFHMGAQGAYVSDGRRCAEVSVYPTRLVDVTGGGNSSSGGFLVGYCESGGDIVQGGKCANAAASIVLENVGVPDIVGKAEQVEAGRRSEAISVREIF